MTRNGMLEVRPTTITSRGMQLIAPNAGHAGQIVPKRASTTQILARMRSKLRPQAAHELRLGGPACRPGHHQNPKSP